MLPIKDEDYKKIIEDSLTTAQEMLNQNSAIMNRILPESHPYSDVNRNIVAHMDDIKYKVKNDLRLTPPDIATINRSLVEYVQKLELAQSHLLYMAESLNEIAPVKKAIHDVHMTQMRFSQEQIQDQVQEHRLRHTQRP